MNKTSTVRSLWTFFTLPPRTNPLRQVQLVNTAPSILSAGRTKLASPSQRSLDLVERVALHHVSLLELGEVFQRHTALLEDVRAMRPSAGEREGKGSVVVVVFV